MDWSSATVVITGASGNIGRALARHYAARAATVVLTGRDISRLEAAAESVPGNVAVCPADLTVPEELVRLCARIEEESGRIDVLIHNAADVTSKPFTETSLEEIEGLIRTNVTGPLQLTRLAQPLLEQGTGRTVVFVSSLAGYKANPAQTVYSISKAAVNAASEALRKELKPLGIHCMTLALSSVSTVDAVQSGQISVEAVIARLDKGIESGESEVFVSPVSKWLMRLYAAFPALKQAR